MFNLDFPIADCMTNYPVSMFAMDIETNKGTIT